MQPTRDPARAYTVSAWQRDFARAFAAGITIECSPTRARGCLLLADNDEPELTADMVRSMVAAKWPGLLDSPLAQAMHGASSMAQLEASDADDAIARHEHEQMRSAALEHALACLWACDGWTVETLSNNIESAFGMDLDGDECDDIARQALGKTGDEPERLTCLSCNGSGEGRTSESRCTSCGGSGVERVISDDSGPDYDEWRKQQADVYLSATKVERADRRALVQQINHPLGAK